MELSFENLILVLAGVLTALQAGLMYDFNVDIVPALRSINGKAHIAMMQAINEKIKNPVFFLSFFGSVILVLIAAFLHWGESQFWWLLAAAVFLLVGNIGVTGFGNIPLNDQLARVDPEQLSEAEADQTRVEYQGPGSAWMRFHALRTISTISATAILFLVCLSK